MKKYPKLVQCDSRGQIVIPKDVRRELNIDEGTGFWVYTVTDEGILLKTIKPEDLDDDNKDIFSNTVDAVSDLHIDIPRFAIYTPYPGTDAFSMMKSQNRILHESWQHYDTQHVVFQPAQMTPDELYQGFRWAYQKTFTRTSLLKRTLISPHPVISFLGNTAYRLYVHRLKRKLQDVSLTQIIPGLMPLPNKYDSLVSANS